MAISSAPSRRQARALRHDAQILDAALSEADEAGWAGLMLAPVAERAGLSWAAVKSRFDDRSALGAALWADRVAATCLAALEGLVAACPEPGSAEDPSALTNALKPFIEPDQRMRVAAELLVVSNYDPEVRAAVQSSLKPSMRQWLALRGDRLAPEQAARHAFLLQVGLGLLARARSAPVLTAELALQIQRVDRALRQQVAATPLPGVSARHIDARVDFGTGNQALEDLLWAVIQEVGEHGYEAATISRICAAAHCTKGMVFARYESKLDLFINASDHMLEAAVNANEQFARRIAEAHGWGLADAVMIREFSLPRRHGARTVMLEQNRLSWHNEELLIKISSAFAESEARVVADLPGQSPADIRSRLIFETALAEGVVLLPALFPGVSRLPMDVVTVPLHEQE